MVFDTGKIQFPFQLRHAVTFVSMSPLSQYLVALAKIGILKDNPNWWYSTMILKMLKKCNMINHILFCTFRKKKFVFFEQRVQGNSSTNRCKYYAPVICNHCPHLRWWAGDSGTVTFSVPPQCRVSARLVIYARGIYYYKEQGYDSQQVPTVQGF